MHDPLSASPPSSQAVQTTSSRALWVAHPLAAAFLIVVLWRLAVAIAGAFGNSLLSPGAFTQFSLVRSGTWHRNPLTLAIDAGIRNDALWYAGIARHGYTFSSQRPSSIAFYPAYPLIVRAVSVVIGNVYIAGMLVSTVCVFLAILLLHVWMKHRGLGGRTPLAVLCLLLFPWSMFYAVMYSEALFLLLVLAAFVWYEQERWLLASACTFALSLSRPNGIFVVVALGAILYSARPRTPAALVPIASGIAGVAAFALYQWTTFGTPIASVRAQGVSPWSRGMHQALLDITLHARPGFPSWYFAMLLTILLLFVAAVPIVYKHFGLPYALFVALSVIFPTASGLVSIERFAAVDFPVFIALACTSHKRALLCLLVFEFYLLLFFAAAFAAGWAVF